MTAAAATTIGRFIYRMQQALDTVAIFRTITTSQGNDEQLESSSIAYKKMEPKRDQLKEGTDKVVTESRTTWGAVKRELDSIWDEGLRSMNAAALEEQYQAEASRRWIHDGNVHHSSMFDDLGEDSCIEHDSNDDNMSPIRRNVPQSDCILTTTISPETTDSKVTATTAAPGKPADANQVGLEEQYQAEVSRWWADLEADGDNDEEVLKAKEAANRKDKQEVCNSGS
jgi:hypothetical protein